jgi:FAD binding domain
MTTQVTQATDPVCGMTVDIVSAGASGLTTEHDGDTYYFCGRPGSGSAAVGQTDTPRRGSDMQTLSVAVVGAGPAGVTAARLLASRGARVSLLEARRLPRLKLCGGGLTPKAQRLVPPSVLETVERRVHRVELRGGWFPALRLDEPEAEIAMVERAGFDLALTEAAAAAGAEVRDGERVEAANWSRQNRRGPTQEG